MPIDPRDIQRNYEMLTNGEHPESLMNNLPADEGELIALSVSLGAATLTELKTHKTASAAERKQLGAGVRENRVVIGAIAILGSSLGVAVSQLHPEAQLVAQVGGYAGVIAAVGGVVVMLRGFLTRHVSDE